MKISEIIVGAIGSIVLLYIFIAYILPALLATLAK